MVRCVLVPGCHMHMHECRPFSMLLNIVMFDAWDSRVPECYTLLLFSNNYCINYCMPEVRGGGGGIIYLPSEPVF